MPCHAPIPPRLPPTFYQTCCQNPPLPPRPVVGRGAPPSPEVAQLVHEANELSRELRPSGGEGHKGPGRCGERIRTARSAPPPRRPSARPRRLEQRAQQ